MAEEENREAFLAGMRADFLRDAAARVRIIHREAEAVAISSHPPAMLATIIREARTLRRGGITFGISSLGEAAGDVEDAATRLLGGDHPPPRPDDLHAAVEGLERALDAARAS